MKRNVLLIVGLLATVAVGSPFSAPFTTEAVKGYKAKADAGDAEAQYRYSLALTNGKGVAKDKGRAFVYAKKAAEQGHGAAINYVADSYFCGIGVKKDFAEAFQWYRCGAEKGDADAMLSLGLCYNRGFGVGMDKKEAVRWCRKAVDLGNDEAMFTLGWCYDRGLGVEQDEQEAVRWYRKAEELGNARARDMLAGKFRKKGGAVGKVPRIVTRLERALELLSGCGTWRICLIVGVFLFLVGFCLLKLIRAAKRLIEKGSRLKMDWEEKKLREREQTLGYCYRKVSLKPGETTYGICEICGQMAEITCREMPMFLYFGKYKDVPRKYFPYLACTDCERKICPTARNRKIAWALGVFIGLCPIGQLAPVGWLVDSYLGRWTGLVEGCAVFLPLFLLIFLTKVKGRHFWGINDCFELRKKNFRLGNKDLKEVISALLAAVVVTVSCVLLVLGAVRLWQDRWKASEGVVIASEVHSTWHKKNSTTIVRRLDVKYQYDYKPSAVTFTGTGYGTVRTFDGRTPANPWAVGKKVTVAYDPSCPERSTSSEMDVLGVGKKASNYLLLYLLVWIGQIIEARKKKKSSGVSGLELSA